jgi:Transglutaminase-like superfamily
MFRTLSIRTARRFVAAPRADRRLLTESVICLMAARLAIALLPMSGLLRRIGTLEEESECEPHAVAAAAARRVAAAIRAVSRHLPSLGSCLPQALAGHAMLRRRGISCTVCLGLARKEGRLAAHAVLRSGRVVLTGGEVPEQYTPVAAYRWTP